MLLLLDDMVRFPLPQQCHRRLFLMFTCRCACAKGRVMTKHHYSRFTAPFTSRVNDMQVPYLTAASHLMTSAEL